MEGLMLTKGVDRWALTNPHLSLHIPDESRLAMSTQTTKNRMPRRPPHSLKSIMSNIHLLTGVPSFARWPLNLHFLSKDARAAWDNWLKTAQKPARADLRILKDYDHPTGTAPGGSSPTPTGIHALPLDYSPMKDYVEKAHNVVLFEREGRCVHCKEDLEPGKGLYPMCPNDGCEAMGHLTCWGEDAHGRSDDGSVLPSLCKCPSCGGEIRWGDMMKELSLRVRGPKEVERLLKKKARAKKAT
jgi:structure-specific endonuclease subunit SLX1